MMDFRAYASRINSLPLLGVLSPSAARIYGEDEKEGYLKCQTLAQNCAREVAGYIQVGWTEIQTSKLMDTWLADHGVKAYFHKPFVWWGDRSCFKGVRTYWDYLPSSRALRDGEPFILDVAPILDGYTADIGYSGCMGENKEFQDAVQYLQKLRQDLPAMIEAAGNGRQLWNSLDRDIKVHGYDNIHAVYPFGVLAHRLHRNAVSTQVNFIHFGWQSYWEFLSRGLFGQIWNQNFEGNLDGLWAIEPHLGKTSFGAKFEEIIVVESGKARWLNAQACFTAERSIVQHDANQRSNTR